MRISGALFVLVLGLALIGALTTFYTVSQTEQAIVLRFGAPQGDPIVKPGLRIKSPLDNVVKFDRRNIGFTLSEEPIVAADQERLVVDAFVRWRIAEPLKFYQAVTDEDGGQARLESLTRSALRRVLGGVNSNDIIRVRRAQLMQAIENDLNRQAATDLGVQIIDVRIRGANFPQATLERVFERMRTERQQVAARLRAEGQEQALRIRAEAERERTVIEATAREQAERTRGVGDAERARVLAGAYGRDAEFAAFYRSMRAYEQSMPAGTQMIIPPDGEFFRYMRSKEGRR
jgi:membrane protease subunit HflC